MAEAAKKALNTLLNPVGLEISTLKSKAVEAGRLAHLQARTDWDRPRYRTGMPFTQEQVERFLNEWVAPLKDDLAALPWESSDPRQYFLNNDWYGPGDAEALYTVLRTLKPKTIVEVGSGFSSRLSRRAISDGKLDTRLISIDPQPRVEMTTDSDEYIRSKVEDVPVSRFAELIKPGDVLFIDSSHMVLPGNDCTFLFLEVLPTLQPGVIVHVHDIFLPYEYPKDWIADGRQPWNEQYLFHALLAGNRDIEILWPGHYAWRAHKELVQASMPNTRRRGNPCSFWYRKSA